MCLNPIKIRNNRNDFDNRYDSNFLYVPCGHCWQCIQSKQYDYEKRAVSEFQNIFKTGSLFNFTLTYNEKYVPKYLDVNVLCRRDVQLFKKRLKARYGDLGKDLKIMYSGEYGKDKDRPHWHILIYCNFKESPYEMYRNVKFSWSKFLFKYKGAYVFESLGYVGLPSKWVDGKLMPYKVQNALLDNVLALRYTIKYVFKSYNFYWSLYKQFTASLKSKGLSDDEIKTFIFPDDERFNFKNHDMDINYICNYFKSCYRAFNDFGLSQQYLMDENYVMHTDFKNDKGSGTLDYSISAYLKRKLFYISCIDGDKVLSTHYTKKWLEYQKKIFELFVTKQENYYICNQDCLLQDSKLNNRGYIYVKDVLNDLTTHVACSLRDFIIYNKLYYNKVFFTDKAFDDIITMLQLRQCGDYGFIDDKIDISNDLVTQYNSYLLLCNQSIAYETYKLNVERYNERQYLIAQEYASIGLPYKLRKIDLLPFSKFINLKSIDSKDEKCTF